MYNIHYTLHMQFTIYIIHYRYNVQSTAYAVHTIGASKTTARKHSPRTL